MPGRQAQVASNLGDDREAVASVLAQALGRVAPEADLGRVDCGANLQRELDLDSMDFLKFVLALEELTGLTIPERDYPRLGSLDGCFAYLEKGAR